jgi:lysophospholipase L1-like esterase
MMVKSFLKEVVVLSIKVKHATCLVKDELGKRLAKAAFLLLMAGCQPQHQAEIAAIGDSVTWGYGALPEGWLIRLQNRTGYEFANLGIPGERAAEGAERLVAALRTVPGAKTVIVLHGGNDWVGIFRGDPCLSGCEPDTQESEYAAVAESLRTIRNRIEGEDRKVVFATYWPGVEQDCPQYTPAQFALYQKHLRYLNDKIKLVASEHGSALVDLGDLTAISAADENYFDCLHPSGIGYDMITDRWIQDIAVWRPESNWAFEFSM